MKTFAKLASYFLFQQDLGAAGITISHITTVESPERVLTTDPRLGHVDAICPAGKVTGGGFSQPGVNVDILDSHAINPTTWRVWGWNIAEVDNPSYCAFAVCMTTTPGAVIASKNSTFAPAEQGKKKRG